MRRLISLALAFVLAGACSNATERPTTPSLADTRDSIVVASFNFAEGRLISDLFATALQKNDYPVRRAFDLGPREIVVPALLQGRVDLVPEYLGTALSFVTLNKGDVSGGAHTLYRELRRAFKSQGVDALALSSAQDKNGIVVSGATASQYDLRRISDLKRVASKMVFGGPPECESRPFCLPGLAKTYGLHFKRFQPTDVGGPVTVSALQSGEVDVALLFTTDPSIDNFVLLKDDRRLQPADNVVPVIRRKILKEYGGGVVRLIDAVMHKLTTDTLRKLNGRLQREGASTYDVARHWLRRQGII